MTTRQVLDLLRDYESRNVTYIAPDGSWPIVWNQARGVHVWDVEGKKYLDMTAAFGVAASGHANPRVVRAGQRQMAKLLHAMGDVHPHVLKAQLARELSRITFERWANENTKHQTPNTKETSNFKLRTSWKLQPPGSERDSTDDRGKGRGPSRSIFRQGEASGKTIFCNSGFEAVEAALKTALLATGKPGVIAFEGAYHGTGYGALNVTHRDHFRLPFREQLGQFACFVPFPVLHESLKTDLDSIERGMRRLFRKHPIGAVLVEPIQVRGGINIPPPQFLPVLRRLCDKHVALLVLDEIYTGFGRTGKWFACEHSEVCPDLICLGKALTGGFPLSACVGRADVMDAAWPPSDGEAIHTSTFLGHPVGCAMALAQIKELESRQLIEGSARLGQVLLANLRQLPATRSGLSLSVRGLGLLAGLELRLANGPPATDAALSILKGLLHCGLIVLPEGPFSNVLSFTPPLTITEQQSDQAVEIVVDALGDYELRRSRSGRGNKQK